jgi:hypothetical protein
MLEAVNSSWPMSWEVRAAKKGCGWKGEAPGAGLVLVAPRSCKSTAKPSPYSGGTSNHT